MTDQAKSTTFKIIAGVLTGLLLLLITMVLSNDKEQAALKVRMDAVEKTQTEIKGQLEQNRTENNTAHTRIEDKLDGIAKELRTK